MFFTHCNLFPFFIFLLFFFFHFIQCFGFNLATDDHEDKILEFFRPLKYGKLCEQFCRSITCQPIKECNNGVVVKNETYCGCCEACVKFLDPVIQNESGTKEKEKPDAECKPIIKGALALGAQRRCKVGTFCNVTSGECKLNNTNENSCLRLQDIRRKHMGTGKYDSQIWIPQCDEEGYYTSKQEKIYRSTCFDKSGKKIFGSADDSLEKTCTCSRHIQNMIKEDPILFYAKPHEHCSSSGSFDTLQCIENLCYCADNNTGEIKSELVKIDFLEMLDCFDEKLHSKDYLQECEKEIQRTKKLAYDFRKKGVDLFGFDYVNCDFDGTYSPKQSTADRYVCTDKKGVGISQYAADFENAKKFIMACNCARDNVNYVPFRSFDCETYGNYKTYTCFGDDRCICIDEDGESIMRKGLKNATACETIIKNLSKYPKEEGDGVSTESDYTSSLFSDSDYTDYYDE